MEYYKSRFKDCNLHKDAVFVLKRINESGRTQSILSAGKQSSLIRWVNHHNIDQLFNHLIGIKNEKADGKIEAGINWLKTSRLEPENILLVGDTIHDREVSRAMGVKCLLIDIGHVSTKRLNRTGEIVLPTLRSILEYLKID